MGDVSGVGRTGGPEESGRAEQTGSVYQLHLPETPTSASINDPALLMEKVAGELTAKQHAISGALCLCQLKK